MSNRSLVANSGRTLVAGSLLWIASIVLQYRYDLFPPGSGGLFVFNQVAFLMAIAAWIVGIYGLHTSGAAGSGTFAKISVGLFGVGWLVLAIAGTFGLVSGDYELLLFPIGGLLATLGSMLAGIAVATTGRWHGWRRYSVLLYALYYFVALWLPAALTNRPPVFATEVLWGVAWLPLAYALIRTGTTPAPTTYVEPAPIRR